MGGFEGGGVKSLKTYDIFYMCIFITYEKISRTPPRIKTRSMGGVQVPFGFSISVKYFTLWVLTQQILSNIEGEI